MSIKEIERIRGSVNALGAYRTGMHALFEAGIIDAMRVLGRPKIRSDSDATHMAAQGAWSAGWNDCLETFLYFEQLYLNTDTETSNVKMTFGSIDKAQDAGDLTEEEANAIRNGKPITYKPDTFTNNINNPKRPA